MTVRRRSTSLQRPVTAVLSPALEALGDGLLYMQKLGNKVVIVERAGSNFKLTDPITLEALGEMPKGALEKIKVNNRLRRAVRDALGGLQLNSKKPADRMAAAEAVFQSKDPDAIPLLDAAIEKETKADVKKAMLEARAAAVLSSDLDDTAKLDAIKVIETRFRARFPLHSAWLRRQCRGQAQIRRGRIRRHHRT